MCDNTNEGNLNEILIIRYLTLIQFIVEDHWSLY